ncbi:hypothetical protein IMZ29_14910 [Achromobacter sp. GG226]|uniref:hypothetical protein n=1 Tax=Verticiella alkaliphila TaxID=2779529 RepID=UPI001C0E612A|nr:hypothetical protein [Verticiella sp. GG226]MBU4611778.1 hypothetical protein [Verticiella sp. GG226]
MAESRTSLAATIHFALDAAFPYPEKAFSHDVYLGINIPRAKLGLAPNQRPGDIDYLIVPFSGELARFDRTIAIEAKVVRPSMKRPGRNANAMGRSQVEGLLRDGFPYVGLVHVSVPERLPPDLHWRVPVMSGKPGPNGELVDTGDYYVVDPFPIWSAERQERRLMALKLPSEVGYRVIGMTLSADGNRFCGNTIGEWRIGTRNPRCCQERIHSVQKLFSEEPHLFSLVRWYD